MKVLGTIVLLIQVAAETSVIINVEKVDEFYLEFFSFIFFPSILIGLSY
jgi:hypothetical protein